MSTTDALFRTLADPSRRAIFERLCREGELTVGALTAQAGISQPAVSQHLKALLDSNLVSVTAEGTKRIYTVNNRGFDKLNLWLDQFWA